MISRNLLEILTPLSNPSLMASPADVLVTTRYQVNDRQSTEVQASANKADLAWVECGRFLLEADLEMFCYDKPEMRCCEDSSC